MKIGFVLDKGVLSGLNCENLDKQTPRDGKWVENGEGRWIVGWFRSHQCLRPRHVQVQGLFSSLFPSLWTLWSGLHHAWAFYQTPGMHFTVPCLNPYLYTLNFSLFIWNSETEGRFNHPHFNGYLFKCKIVNVAVQFWWIVKQLRGLWLHFLFLCYVIVGWWFVYLR